ncbi:MAG: polyprenol monophosphomannose synthase [Chloroflexi bacterium]|nr:polyprenol monophosphomannose synthase [Chloroflexota bacterium]MCL5075249.1 polyprenol monophosphomannose synthase [Chloroflexota bacterium]
MKTMIIIPTYNEAENLSAMVEAIFTLDIPDLQILIVDDSSTDGTGEIAEKLVAIYPNRIHVIHRPAKLGLGTAYIAGFRFALEHDADRIIEMDADFSHSPAYLPTFLEKIQQYDVVVGSRYVPGGRVDANWNTWRRFLSWWANSLYARLILGLQVRDSTAGFKCFRRAVLEGLDLSKVRSQGYAFQIEMAYACQKKSYRVLEIPIVFNDRAKGQSKMSPWISLEAAWRVWQIKWRY